jgi:pimeloyl-ACP methyl ester carboxylesterase
MNVFGYSMGGYVAMCLARHQPSRIARIAALGTKFDWSPETAAREPKFLDPEKIAAKVPAFAETLRNRHTANDWQTVCRATAEMLTVLGEKPLLQDDDFRSLQKRIRVMVGDRDSNAGIDASTHVYRALPNAELEILPNTPHPLEQVSTERLRRSLIHFFTRQ